MKISNKNLRSFFQILAAIGLSITSSKAATNNSGNSPGFILIDLCSNGIGDSENSYDITRMEPGVFDIGVDLGADGNVDLWLSEENAEYLGRGNSDTIGVGAWRRLFFYQLDQYVGQTMSFHIVDQSESYYLAINAIRVNAADGGIVQNAIENGFFEGGLTGWTVESTNITNPSSLIVEDPNGDYVQYSGKFLSTMTDINSGDFTEKATLISAPFVLPEITSFIYGNVSGGASEFVNIEGALGSDNKSGVYIDLGTTTQAPDGHFDINVDLPLIGCYGGSASAARNAFYSVFINTSGLEGIKAQVVGFDDSLEYHIGLDAFRMNWDWEEKIIKNGGFDQGIPSPGSDDPNLADWLNDEQGDYLIHTDHPSGGIPNWQVIKKEGAFGEAFWFDSNSRDDHMSGRAWIGTGGGDVSNDGVEIRSDIFTIEPIPLPEENVFVQFASAQGSNRLRYGGESNEEVAFGRIELIVDTNNDGLFDTNDFIYTQTNQAMAHNMSNSHRDLWHHPEYRWYIRPEHQGLMALFKAEDRFGPFKASYGWMCVDDLFVWNGQEARLAFPNSDFEMGTMQNWNETINGGNGFTTWLSGSKASLDAGLVTHSAMNNRSTDIDGDFAADTASNQTGGGDSGMGVLASQPFALPILNRVNELRLGLVYNYGFDDETLQGWTQVGTSMTGPEKLGLISQNNPEVGDSEPPAPLTSPAFIGPVPFEAQDGDNTRDRAHDTLILRSPEFPLYANGEISFALVGGSKPGMDLAEINQFGLPESSSGSGSIGVALRKANSGEYLTFSARSSNDGQDWETIVLDNDDFGDLFEEGEHYTLDFIDYHSGGWGWAAMDDITIRPGAPASAAISSVRLQDGAITIEYTGQLETSTDLLGDWLPVENSTSPYSALIGPGNMFFRASEMED